MRNLPLNILLVEDSAVHAGLIRETLLAWSRNLRIAVAASLAEARAFLERTTPDLALLDLMLSDGRGWELLPAEGEQADFPCVLLTSSGDERSAVQALKAGALDYLVKGEQTLADLPYVVERTLREWGHIRLRREAEADCRRREEQLRLALEAGGMGTWEWVPETDEVRWDAGQRRLFGLSEDAPTPCREAIWRLFHPDDRERATEMMRRALETGELRDEIRILLPDGAVRWIATTGRLHRDPEGRPARMLGVNFDITERKRGDMRRDELLAELEATIQAIADGVVVFGPGGETLRMNPAAERVLGASFREPLDRRVDRLRIETPEGTPFPLERTPGWRALRGETVHGTVMVFHPPGRGKIWVSASAGPIRAVDGRLLGAVGTFTDITSLRELQQDRDLFLHTISHDLRTPLTVIQGYGQLLHQALAGKERPDEGPLMMCDQVLQGAAKMKRMIDTLVDVARLEGGKTVPSATALRLEAFLEQLLVRLEGLHLAGGPSPGRLTVAVPDDLPEVLADPELLERILMNLLTNAFKYSPAGTPIRVEVRLREGEAEIAVIDRGEGIPVEDQPRIFQGFYRNSRRPDSVGLGLYITRKLVEAHDGRIRLESLPGQGSTFAFTLPTA